MAGELELTNVTVLRPSERGSERPVVADLSLEVRAGERVALVGRNGAGKTSLLLALVGALPITGSITLGGVAIGATTLDHIRRRVGFVFADPSDQLFCRSVEEEVAFGPRQLGLESGEIERRVQRSLAAVRLDTHRARLPTALSLGEQRRLAIAAALAMQPELYLIDEPTAALDPRARRELIDVVRDLEATVVVATHDLDAVLDLEARTIVLDEGRAVADGPATQILRDQRLLDAAGLALPLSLTPR